MKGSLMHMQTSFIVQTVALTLLSWVMLLALATMCFSD